MAMAPRRITGDPFALPIGPRDTAVEGGGKLQRDERPPLLLLHEPTGHGPRCFCGHQPGLHRNASSFQARNALAVGAGIRIGQRDHNACDTGRRQTVGAIGSARTFMRAGFQCDIGGRTARQFARLRQCHRVLAAGLEVRAVLDQLRTQCAHGGVLLAAVAVRHDDQRGHAVTRSGKGDGLAVVATGGADDAGRALLARRHAGHQAVEVHQPAAQLERADRGVVCLDTVYGKAFVKQSEIPVVTITSLMGVDADWHVGITAETPKYTSFVLAGPNGVNIRSRVPLLGAHMAANAGLAIVMLIEAGFSPERIQAAIINGIDAYLPGRTERVTGATGPDVYVDFGHSPDAFLNTLAAVRKVTEGRVFMVFGADGDRDATKRPDMARVAAEGSDVLVITDHHPRFEDPASIRKTLVEAAKAARPNLEIYEVSPPEAAIRKAVSMAQPGDAILWAGPGHQDYRDIRGVRTPYSARAEARAALKENGWA